MAPLGAFVSPPTPATPLKLGGEAEVTAEHFTLSDFKIRFEPEVCESSD